MPLMHGNWEQTPIIENYSRAAVRTSTQWILKVCSPFFQGLRSSAGNEVKFEYYQHIAKQGLFLKGCKNYTDNKNHQDFELFYN